MMTISVFIFTSEELESGINTSQDKRCPIHSCVAPGADCRINLAFYIIEYNKKSVLNILQSSEGKNRNLEFRANSMC